MYRSDIYTSLSKDIAQRLNGLDLLSSEDEFNDIVDNADDGTFSGIFSGVHDKDIFTKIADNISNWDGTDGEISTGTNYFVFDVAPINHHYFKKIGVYDDNSNFLCVALNFLADLKNDASAAEMGVLERIWAVIGSDANKKDEFWNFVRNGRPNRYLLITDSNPSNIEEGWRLYSYGYLLYCNANKFIKPPVLGFASETPFSSSMSLINTAKYEQFYEVYDLINEAHYCDDVLRRYLNMYQIIENLCYRRHLAKISYGSIKKNAFVRKSLSKFGNGSKSENKEIPEGIVELFPNLNSIITRADFTTDNIAFLEDEYNITIGASISSEKIAKIIYQLRNSIAHNKATELHFAYANVDDYLKIIDLIKKLINKLEPAIINLIGVSPHPDPTKPHPLEYDKRTFEVY